MALMTCERLALVCGAMQIMVRWLSRFFNYLDRYYIQVGMTACRGLKCWDGKLRQRCTGCCRA